MLLLLLAGGDIRNKNDNDELHQ